jgi:hypothetical protein
MFEPSPTNTDTTGGGFVHLFHSRRQFWLPARLRKIVIERHDLIGG